jgi:kinesin family protein C2/C3
MFEQRLTHDELGVAIRKISHSGKAQLRYVKCVVLRPPSSSDFGGGGSSTNTNILANNNSNNDAIIMGVGGCVDDDGGIPGIGTYLEKKNGEAAKLQGGGGGGGCDVSVSSSVSSRFMEKIKSVVGRNNNINKNILSSNSIHGGGGGGGCGDDDDDDDNKSLLLDQEPTIGSISPTSRPGGCGGGGSSSSSTHRHPNKSLRALTWGKKNAITVPLDKFSCVRKGKTTQRTIRNGASASRLLSIVVSSGCCDEQESLDIEAPTRLDRDKFASAFARFLGVPLIEEEEYEMEGNNNGRAERSVVSGGESFFHASFILRIERDFYLTVDDLHPQNVSAARRKLRTPSLTRMKKGTLSSNMSSAASSEPGSRNDLTAARSSGSIDAMPAPAPKFRRAASAVGDNSSSLLPALTPNSDEDDADNELAFFNPAGELKQTIAATPADIARDTATKTTTAKSVVSRDGAATPTCPSITGSSIAMSESARKRITNNPGQSESMLEPQDKTLLHVASSGAAAADEHGPTISAQKDDREDDASHISSITGGVDQEIVEELHQAIIELRAELDASRAEAARAVKVAEQAIQSAENCSSSDWNSTVTHKAAEAAAQAQKRSAEAIARARMAEERLSAERKSTAFWRRQAQAAEEEAGSLKTKSAGAEVKRAVLVEELASERRKAARMFASLRQEFVISERGHVNELNNALEKKRAIEMEFEHVKKELMEKKMELQRIADAERDRSEKARGSTRMALSFRSSKKSSSGSTSALTPAKSVTNRDDDNTIIHDVLFEQRALALESLAQVLRRECDEIRLKSTDEINSLKLQSKEWANQADRAVAASRAETELLREKLAAESAMRLKLLNELQDIRGTVRVYCRPKPGATKPILSIPTQDILIVNEDSSPVSFKFDRVFSPGTSQYELFSELEEPIVSSLDGFNVTLLAFGQQGSGKTYSILGNCNFHETGFPCLKSHGVQLQALQQLFTIAGHRKGRYKDSFSVTMVEVHNEKLFDLVSGVSAAETDGEVVICETRRDKRKNVDTEADWLKGKLEIRTNIDGNTVVQGLVSIRINSFEDACKIWQESIANRLERLRMQGSDLKTYERNSNVITTIHIQSTNIATGVGTEGRLQFVDMAASDITQNPLMSSNDHRGVVDGDTAKFSNKSIEAFDDVVNARCQFDRSVPYRNATLTHLLRDSLEADAKVLLLCCISSDEADIDNTMSVLRFASRMQGVSIGKATKHIIGSKE